MDLPTPAGPQSADGHLGQRHQFSKQIADRIEDAIRDHALGPRRPETRHQHAGVPHPDHAVFDGVSDDTFDNALGGVHALILEDGELIAHGSVVQRRMLYDGRALRTGYVEGVAVRADRRRRGHGDAVMAELERVIRSAYHLGALGASPLGSHLYAARGWQLWQGPSSALTPDGIRRTANHDGAVYVLPVSVPLDLTAELTCDHRPAAPW